MSGGTGGNPQAGKSKGTEAEELANAMAGLSDTFDDLINETRNAAGLYVFNGYTQFLLDNEENIKKVQDHGMTLANNIQAGASEIARTDLEATDDYQGAWPGLSRDINGGGGMTHQAY